MAFTGVCRCGSVERMGTDRKRWRLAVVLLCLATTGCAGGGFVACPAIGYISTVRISLLGNIADVREVRLCDPDGNCSVTQAELQSQGDGPLTVIEPGQLDQDPPTPEPSQVPAPLYIATHDGGNDWSVQMPFGVPEEAVVTAYRADGSIAGETSAELEWRRVGGSEQCGGPMEAGPIEVAVG